MSWRRVVAVWAVAGCYRPADYSRTTFICDDDEDCLDLQHCVAGTCALIVDAPQEDGACMPCFGPDVAPDEVLNVPLGPNNDACDLAAATVVDTVATGLPLAIGGSLTLIDLRYVSSCIAVGFGAELHACDRIRMTARRGNACGNTCSTNPTNYCDRPTSMDVFLSPDTDLASFKFQRIFALEDTFRSEEMSFAFTPSTHYVIVCRTGDGPATADVLVDAVRVCRAL